MERLGEKHVVSETFLFTGPFCNSDLFFFRICLTPTAGLKTPTMRH